MKISKKLLRSPLIRNMLCRLVAAYIWLTHTTTRWTIIHTDGAASDQTDKKEKKPSFYLFWHGRLFMMPMLFKDAASMEVVVSQHNDGEYIARIVRCFGFEGIRGSTDRGGMQAARAIMKCLSSGKHVGISPDGPRGPRMRINSNLVAMAERTGSPIIPVSYSVANSTIFNSWDRFMLPRPFSKGVIVFGKNFIVPKDSDQAMRESMRKMVEDELNRITHEADRLVGRDPVLPDAADAKPKKKRNAP